MYALADGQKLILGSASPRRRRLFEECGLQFSVEFSEIDEEILPQETPEALVRRLALEKALDVALRNPGAWVVGADSVVVIGGAVLGKPVDRSDAERMLKLLSSETHEVFGGLAVVNSERGVERADFSITEVSFIQLDNELLHEYLSTKEPYDKAGSYGIQGLGGSFVSKMKGSYSNVVGLDMTKLIAILRSEKVLIPELEQ